MQLTTLIACHTPRDDMQTILTKSGLKVSNTMTDSIRMASARVRSTGVTAEYRALAAVEDRYGAHSYYLTYTHTFPFPLPLSMYACKYIHTHISSIHTYIYIHTYIHLYAHVVTSGADGDDIDDPVRIEGTYIHLLHLCMYICMYE